MLKTYVKCSCGKEFVNATEIGYAFAIVEHMFKQIFYNISAQIHFILHKHKKAGVYETYE